MKTKKIAGAALRLLVLLIMTVITLYPVIWMLSGSMKSDEEFYKNIWGLASAIRPENYVSAWVRGSLGGKYFNSVFVTALFLVIILPVNCCVAYVIARMQFRGRKFLYMFLLMGMMVPGGVLGMPTFSVALKLKLVDTLYGIALVYCGQAISFGMFLMRSFYISLPKSLEEAAMIDGCTRFRSFVHVILPLTIPGIMTQVVFSGLNTWNESLYGEHHAAHGGQKDAAPGHHDVRGGIQHLLPAAVRGSLLRDAAYHHCLPAGAESFC